MFFPVADWLPAFALTVVAEVPVGWLLLRRAEPVRERVAVLVLYANLATHPVVWFVLTQLLLVGTLPYRLVAEGWAVAAEAVFYAVAIRGLPVRRAAAAALAANLVSFAAGRVLLGSLAEVLP